MDVFVRNGFDYPVRGINGEIHGIVPHKNEAGVTEKVEIAVAYFALSFMGTIQPGSIK